MELNSSELKKYSRQLILKNIGILGQKKLFNSKVLVVGAGGLGCPLMLYLAYSGVGNLGIVDNDRVEISNLSRQVLFTKKDLGKFKVMVSKNFIKRINKKILVKTFLKKINKENIHNIAKNYDFICDGTDNFKSRLLINDYCIKYKKVLISSAISKYDGHIFNFDFRKDGPCLRCFMPSLPSINQSCESEGIMSTLAGIAGSLQANEVIKSVLNIGKPLKNEIMIFNALDLNFRKVKLKKNSSCRNHLHVLGK
tara:strand:+ start:564 stop:1322 length:759 start_codon:yes stop_codon:yes gene_type:complete